jgi:rhodanese-related sulfurtransferase
VSENEGKTTESAAEQIFRELPRRKRHELVRAMEHRVVAPLTIICRQGEPGDKFYFIRSGKVRVFTHDSDGFETVISESGPGESFGEIALITGEPRMANIEAIEETHLMVLSKEEFERILREYPGVTVAFMKEMSGWLMKSRSIVEEEVRQQYLAPRASWFDFVLIIGVSLVIALLFNHSNPNGVPLYPKFPDKKAIAGISPTKAMEEMKNGDTLIVDAGPEGSYQRNHIRGAISVPFALSDILYDATFGAEEKGKKVIVYGGTFSKPYDWLLADKLLHKGHKDVKVLQGGTAAWEKAGYPVDKWEEKK